MMAGRFVVLTCLTDEILAVVDHVTVDDEVGMFGRVVVDSVVLVVLNSQSINQSIDQSKTNRY